MKKAVFMFLAAMIIIGFAMNDSMAGQLCWQKSGVSDIIKVSVTDTGSGHKLVNGFTSTSSYLLPVTGSFEKDLDGVHRILSLNATNTYTDSWGGNRSCVITGVLDPSSTPKWQGTVTTDCGNGDFVTTRDLIRINCSTLKPLANMASQSLKGDGDPN